MNLDMHRNAGIKTALEEHCLLLLWENVAPVKFPRVVCLHIILLLKVFPVLSSP